MGIIKSGGDSVKYICSVCGWVYNEDEQEIKWENLPNSFKCPLCNVGKNKFEKTE
ncbi:MAG: rubredoxin [Clostridia bacterium]|nr:rubredoxin [Clostridia bacterium]